MIPTMIVPVLNRPDLLERMFASVDTMVSQLIIIDNGRVWLDTKRTRPEWARDVHVLKIPNNLGVAASWNLGIKVTPFSPYWLIVNFDVVWPAGSLQRMDHAANESELVLSGGAPPWCAFALGDKVVERVGLFDESFHPAYFEDNDYTDRMHYHGLTITHTDIPVEHDNSSTIKNGYEEHNRRTYMANKNYLDTKRANNDFTQGGWDLTRRRDLSW